MRIPVFRLAETFAVLKPDLSQDAVPVTPGLYGELDQRFAGFAVHVLIAEYAFDTDWPTWECHPAGDELVVLLAGSVILHLLTADGERTVTLATPGEAVIVPRNTWHTAAVQRPARMLFVTPGEGTGNREFPPDAAG